MKPPCGAEDERSIAAAAEKERSVSAAAETGKTVSNLPDVIYKNVFLCYIIW